ncbi:MAG: DUF3298 domain-containing protein [Symbiobacteriia bacterium]
MLRSDDSWPTAALQGVGLVARAELPGVPASGPAKVTVECMALGTATAASDDNLAVPLFALRELGIEAQWKMGRKQMEFKNRHKTLTLLIGETKARAGHHEIMISPAPRVAGGRLVTPLRPLAENLAFSVQWNNGSQSINLSKVQENPVTIKTKRDRSESEKLSIDIQYPQLSGGIPSGVAQDLNERFAAWAQDIRKTAEENAAQPLPPTRPAYTTVGDGNYRVTYNTHGIFSIVLEAYSFTGGAHGMTTRTPYTVSFLTGQTYQLQDLFKPGVDYVRILSDEIKKQMKERDLEQYLLQPFDAIKPDEKFYIEDGNLVIFFDLYEYFPYAWGFQEFPIPMASLQPYLVPELAHIQWTEACP